MKQTLPRADKCRNKTDLGEQLSQINTETNLASSIQPCKALNFFDCLNHFEVIVLIAQWKLFMVIIWKKDSISFSKAIWLEI